MKKDKFDRLNVKPETLARVKTLAGVKGVFMHKIVELAVDDLAHKLGVKFADTAASF